MPDGDLLKIFVGSGTLRKSFQSIVPCFIGAKPGVGASLYGQGRTLIHDPGSACGST